MNPRLGDTVISTKATTSTTNTTTNLTTTGEHTATSLRKHRQQLLRQPRRCQIEDVSRVHPEIKLPLKKSRRRTTQFTESTERSPSKSRLGDFLSTLAFRIRGPKHSSDMDDYENSKNRRVSDEYTSGSVQLSMKRDGNEFVENRNVECSKRRKIEAAKSVDQCSAAIYKENYDTIPKNVRLVEQYRDSAASSECNDKTSEETKELLEEETRAQVEHGHAITNIHNESNGQQERSNSGKSLYFCESGASILEEIEESKEKMREEEKNTDASIICSISNLTVNLSRESVAKVCMGTDNINKLDIVASDSGQKDCRAESDVGICSGQHSLRSMMKSVRRNDDATRLRKTIQWLEEGARRLREDLASTRSELYEERKATKLARREYDSAVKEARNAEAVKYAGIVAELKARLAQPPSRSANDCFPSISKTDILKDENHRREVAALKKRLAEAETTIQKLKANSLDRGRVKKRNKEDENVKGGNPEMRKLAIELQSLRTVNKKLENKFHIAEKSARARATELRAQHEAHEAELSTLQKTLRSDTIKMIDEIQSKNREIEKLERLLSECTQINQRLRTKEDETMRKLRESERNHQVRLAPKIEEKSRHDEQVVDMCKAECDGDEKVAVKELDRLREIAIEQQETIEELRQIVKEKERKLEQLSNKRRKEEFYKQWMELEPVAEVDDEEEQELEDGGDSALSSAPSSLSPQPSSHNNAYFVGGVTREAYESVLMEIEELQTKLLEEKQALIQARRQVSELEEALLQEAMDSQLSKRILNEKLRIAEGCEASLIAEISELREQNELLEFRVLELEESPNLRNTSDPADSGIVSPEPIHLYKEHPMGKQRDRAVATVIPYSSTYNQPTLVTNAQKAPLSLQESGIFVDENEDEAEHQPSRNAGSTSGTSSSGTVDTRSLVKVSNQTTQTEAPVGELLQEVQRLQDLRARIQERAAKVPAMLPVNEYNNEAMMSCDNCNTAHERIYELKERLSQHESERKLSKQREEELLDENYRLAERTYLLESKMKTMQDKFNCMVVNSDVQAITKRSSQKHSSVQTNIPMEQNCTEASKLYEAAVKNFNEVTSMTSVQGSCQLLVTPQYADSRGQPCSDCDVRIRGLTSTDSRLRQQIAGMEYREAAFFETLRQADATWAKLEADYESKQREMTERLTAQLELNRALFEHLTNLNKSVSPKQLSLEPAKTQEQTDRYSDCASVSRSSSSATSRSSMLARSDSWSSRLSTISLTRIRMPSTVGYDKVDASESYEMPVEPPTEEASEAKEEEKQERTDVVKIKTFEDQHFNLQQPESHVSIDESPGENKQIIYFRWR